MICVVMTLHHDHYLKLLALTCINRVEIKYRHGRESTVINFLNLPTTEDIFQNKIPQYSKLSIYSIQLQSIHLENHY